MILSIRLELNEESDTKRCELFWHFMELELFVRPYAVNGKAVRVVQHC